MIHTDLLRSLALHSPSTFLRNRGACPYTVMSLDRSFIPYAVLFCKATESETSTCSITFLPDHQKSDWHSSVSLNPLSTTICEAVPVE